MVDEPNDTRALASLRQTSKLRELRLDPREFGSTLRLALTLASTEPDKHSDARVFLDNVITRLLVQPQDVLRACAALEDEKVARQFMRLVARHPLSDRDLLHAIVESPEVFFALPEDSEWKEVLVLVYGSDFLNAHAGAKVAIQDFAPLGLDVEPAVVRSLVGSAFDEGILCDEDVARLLELFPRTPTSAPGCRDEQSRRHLMK